MLQEEREVTMALLRYKTPLAAVSLPRYINTSTEMQAAAPALEITRLLHLLGLGTDVLRAFAGVLLRDCGLSVFIALWSAVRERRADLALLRMLGAPPGRVAALLLCEALWLGLLASSLGLLLGHGLAELLGRVLQAQGLLPVTGLRWLACRGRCALAGGGRGHAGRIGARAAGLPQRRGRPAGTALNLFKSL